MIDLEFDDIQRAVADSVEHYCRDRCTEEVLRAAAREFPMDLWRGLAELGVLALATPEGAGGPLEVCAVHEVLGRFLFPGPLAATFFATQVLLDAERADVVSGETLVSLGTPPLMPWAPLAGHFVIVDGSRAYSGRACGDIEAVDTIGGEPWGRVEVERVAALGGGAEGRALHHVALAAYIAAAGHRLVEVTCEHARTRNQFGRAIGDFQAVAHPLADCTMRLDAAATLARAAAFYLDRGERRFAAYAAAARVSACGAALHAVYVCHQSFGAMGVTLEGPVYPFTRRIRQLAATPPGDGADHDAALGHFTTRG